MWIWDVKRYGLAVYAKHLAGRLAPARIVTQGVSLPRVIKRGNTLLARHLTRELSSGSLAFSDIRYVI